MRTFLSRMFLRSSWLIILFFFSSRRRHTRWTGDWSSDVCSSDLGASGARYVLHDDRLAERLLHVLADDAGDRSEERRVGKECSCRQTLLQFKNNRTRRIKKLNIILQRG